MPVPKVPAGSLRLNDRYVSYVTILLLKYCVLTKSTFVIFVLADERSGEQEWRREDSTYEWKGIANK